MWRQSAFWKGALILGAKGKLVMEEHRAEGLPSVRSGPAGNVS